MHPASNSCWKSQDCPILLQVPPHFFISHVFSRITPSEFADPRGINSRLHGTAVCALFAGTAVVEVANSVSLFSVAEACGAFNLFREPQGVAGACSRAQDCGGTLSRGQTMHHPSSTDIVM
jgi:hypothetical protein